MTGGREVGVMINGLVREFMAERGWGASAHLSTVAAQQLLTRKPDRPGLPVPSVQPTAAQRAVSGQYSPLIPTHQPEVPADVLCTGFKSEPPCFLPEQRRAPKCLHLTMAWMFDHHAGELLQ